MAKSSAEAGIWYVPLEFWYVPLADERDSDPHADCAGHEMLAALLLDIERESLRASNGIDVGAERPSRMDLSFLADARACAGILEPSQAALAEPGGDGVSGASSGVRPAAFLRMANPTVTESPSYEPDIIAAFDLIG